MNWLSDLFTNPFLMVSLGSWFIAQMMKVVIDFFIHKTWNWERLFGDGGMPSGHSATVASLATYSALACGTASFQFAVTTILAVIVCHDAMGVRLETGKQAIVINELLESLLDSEKRPEVKLKEFVGHTPIQVIAGILIGVLDAIALYYLFFR